MPYPTFSYSINPLEITHGDKTANDLNKGFDRVNPLYETLAMISRF